jgi:hypothetical protein
LQVTSQNSNAALRLMMQRSPLIAVIVAVLIVVAVAESNGDDAELTVVVLTRGASFGVLRNSLKALSADAALSPPCTVAVVVAPTAQLSMAAQDALTSAVHSSFAAAAVLAPSNSSAAALNAAFAQAVAADRRPTVLVAIEDSVEVAPGFCRAALYAATQLPPALLGCRLMNEDAQTLYHTGVDFAAGKIESDRYVYNAAATTEISPPIPVPVYVS